MTIKELYIRKPFNSHGDKTFPRDYESNRAAITDERAHNMSTLNAALNEGFVRIDSYDFGAYRVIVLHKTTPAEKDEAHRAEIAQRYIDAGIDPETGLKIERKNTFGIPVPDSDRAV